MQSYTGTKKVNATPMNRLDYNNLRGWDLPEDEDGTDAGYLVEYVDGGKANHPDFAGYISWSPKDVFERAYRLNEDQLESMIQEKGLTAPKVTPEDVKNNIASVHYFTAAEAVYASDCHQGTDTPLHLLTFCVLVLKNGFTVTGESACASPDNFDAEIGKKIAYDNALNKVWPLMGYTLKESLHKNAM